VSSIARMRIDLLLVRREISELNQQFSPLAFADPTGVHMSGILRAVAQGKRLRPFTKKHSRSARTHSLLVASRKKTASPLIGCVLRLFPLIAILGHAAPQTAGNESALPVLTNIARIKQLRGNEATRGYQVCVRGIVTFQNGVRDLVVHDSVDGIFVARTNASSDFVQGQLVEVRGVTGLAGYAPRVEANEIVALGSADLPPPRHLSFDWLSSGREDCQWIEVRGVVRSVTLGPNDHHFDISMDGNRLRVCVLDCTITHCGRLIDSTVRVRGVLGSNRNSKQQILAPLLWATSENVFVEEVAGEDPFATPIRPAASLLQFAPDSTPNHRVRIRGVVTHQSRGNFLFVRDCAQGLWLQTRQTTALKPGQIVEAVGFEGMGKYSPVLQDVIFRRVGEGAVPQPAAITAKEALRGDHDADLVEITGQLLDSFHGGDDRIFVLQSDRAVFNAYLPKSANVSSTPRNGSTLKLTGICLIDDVLKNVDKVRPTAFRLLLRSPEDVVVIQKPSWWTLSRLLWALVALASVTLASSAWVVSLRRRVQLQTGIITKKIQREAVLEERHRVAREIHDTLAQSFSGVGFQLESIASQLSPNAPVWRQFDIARQMVRHGQEEFRRSLVNLRAQELERGELPEALGESGRQMTAGSGVGFELAVCGVTRRLDEALENNLLRIAQECITNALRHAHARRISTELAFEPAHVRLCISDDGGGFDARKLEQIEGEHFGWRGIRERAKQVRAQVTLNSRPGQTTVVVTVAT
jgi:signal transduction histidine kinase